MSCQLTGGYKLPACVFSMAGIQRIYLANFDPNFFATGTTIDMDNVITAFDPTCTFYEFDLIQETGSFNTTIPTNVQNASQYYESIVELVIAKNNPTLRNQISAIAASPMYIIAETRSNDSGLNPATYGDSFLVGATLGAWTTTGKVDAGKKSEDFHGFNISMTAKEPVAPYFIYLSGVTISQ